MTTDQILRAVAIIIPIFIFVLSSTWVVVGWLVNSLKQSLNQRFDDMSKDLKSEATKIASVERSLLELKAELPREYTRREDHIRYSAIIEAKLDNHGAALQTIKAQLQSVLDNKNTGGPQA